VLLLGCGSSKRDVAIGDGGDGDGDADASADGGSSDGGAGGDADADADSDADADADADTVCEDLVNGCGYDRGCDGLTAPGSSCVCSRDRPEQAECLPATVQTTCDTCLSFGAVAWFCAEYQGDGWRWRRADTEQAWRTCTQDQRCDARTCHGANGDETWVCDGEAFVPADDVHGCGGGG